MNPFVVREIRRDPFEHCGRMFLKDESLRIVVDGWRMVDIRLEVVEVVLLGLGKGDISDANGEVCGQVWLSESGNGFYYSIGERKFVTPVKRVNMVLCGIHKKAAVFQKIELDPVAK